MADKDTPKQARKFETVDVVVMVPITLRVEYRECVDSDGVPYARFEDADLDRSVEGWERTRREIGEEVGEDTAEVVAALDEITKQLAAQFHQDVADANANEVASFRAGRA